MVENIFRQKQWKIFSTKIAGKYFPVEKVFHRADEFSLKNAILIFGQNMNFWNSVCKYDFMHFKAGDFMRHNPFIFKKRVNFTIVFGVLSAFCRLHFLEFTLLQTRFFRRVS